MTAAQISRCTEAELGHDVGPKEHDVPMDRSLHTSVDEIADQVFRFSTWVPDISEHGFTFNQFLLTGDQPSRPTSAGQ